MAGAAWKVQAKPDKPKEAIAFFKAKTPMSQEAFDKLSADAKKRAFVVAQVSHLDMVNDVHQALTSALEDGTTFEEFRAQIGDALEKSWGGSVENPAWRMETIFRTNLQTAYSAGRNQMMRDPEVKAIRPMWLFDAIEDDRTSDFCDACADTVLPAEDSFWLEHTPPLHHNCRSQLIALTAEQAKEMGGETTAPAALAATGFGAPAELGDTSWEPTEADYPPALWKARPEDT